VIRKAKTIALLLQIKYLSLYILNKEITDHSNFETKKDGTLQKNSKRKTENHT
jgi:hypothetical protein